MEQRSRFRGRGLDSHRSSRQPIRPGGALSAVSGRAQPSREFPLGLGLALLLGSALACEPSPQATGPTRAERIISLSPIVTEITFALGLGDRVVGLDDYSAWPPEVSTKPRLGGLYNPNFEAIITLQPDLAILLPGHRELGDKLQHLGIDVLEVRSDSLTDVEQAMTAIARRCGVPESGDSLLVEFRAALVPRPLPESPRVMISLDREPGRLNNVFVAGKGSFYEELLARLGATNIFADSLIAFPQVGLEAILARRPQVILEIRYQEIAPDSELAVAMREDWQPFEDLPAVRDGRIVVFGGSHMVVPGPRLPLIYRQLEAALRTTP